MLKDFKNEKKLEKQKSSYVKFPSRCPTLFKCKLTDADEPIAEQRCREMNKWLNSDWAKWLFEQHGMTGSFDLALQSAILSDQKKQIIQ